MPLRLTQYRTGKALTPIPNVFEGSNGKYYVVISRDGHKRRFPFATPGAAREAARNVALLFPAPTLQPARLILSEVAARFRPEDELRNANSEDHARQERNLVRLLRDPPLRNISRSDVVAYQIARLGEDVGPQTVNHETKRLHRLLNLAVRDGLIEHNPISGYQKLKTPPGRIRWLSYEEEETFEPYFSEEDWRIVQIAFLSGMRQAELFTCKRVQILWSSNTIYLPKTKKGEPRHVPMGEDLAAAIRAQLDLGTPWLCPNRSRTNRLSARNFYRTFEKARDAAGIEDLTWHDLRHTYCSRLAMLGVPLRTIQTLAGHKNYSTTERYAHLSQEHLQDAARVLDRIKADTSADTRERNPRASNGLSADS